MASADTFIPFVAATLAFAFVPGPGMLHAVAQTMARGRRAGWWSAFGFHLAGLGHIGAAAAGITLLLTAVPALFTAMKLAGAIYLIWMGARYLTSRDARDVSPASPAMTGRKAVRDGVMVEALNPKSALFFMLFLPQFADPAAALPVWLQIAVLGCLVNVTFTLSDVLLIELSHGVARRAVSTPGAMRLLRSFGGGVLIALGVKLAFARQG